MKYKYARIVRKHEPLMNISQEYFGKELDRLGARGYKVINKLDCGDATEYLLMRKIKDKKYLKINKDRLIDLGFKEEDGNFFYEKGRCGFVVSKAQGSDLILLYRSDIGGDYNPLRFIKYIHELQDLFFAITGNKLKSKKHPLKKQT